MPGFCNVVLSGHLGRDSNLKDVNGQAVLEFSVAYNDRKDDPPTWYNCAIWGSRGEKLAKHLTKGTAVIVSGTQRVRLYKAKDGTDKFSLDIRVDQFSFAGGRGEPKPEAASAVDVAREVFHDSTAVQPDDDQIPF